MNRLIALVLVGSLSLSITAEAELIDELAWAYAISPPAPAPAGAPRPDAGTSFSLPGSERSFTLRQIRNPQGPADWFPSDHPQMPPIVAQGRESAGIMACSLCHYPNGKGRPENAGVAGLEVGYFLQQLQDLKNGLRLSAEPRKANSPMMAAFAHAMTDDEMRQAAEYFGAMEWSPWIDVVETDTVPKTRISGGMYLELEGADAGTEPLGRRIIEMPKSTMDTEVLRNPRSGFRAYVPEGSVARGEAIVTTGGGKTTECTVCHGADLAGLALVPPLRGRSPSYIARQLVDFKEGTRHGVWAPLMGPVVAELTADDILNISAYLASLPPRP
jgi:cytochrome c553